MVNNYRDGLYIGQGRRLRCWDGVWYVEGARSYWRAGDDIVIDPQAVADYDALHSGRHIYVRLGNLPASGRSRNHLTGNFEPGVSCFRAAWVDGELLIEGNAGSILFESGRDLYEVAGDLLDETGSDGEPLLANARIVKRLKANIRFAKC